MGLNFYRKHLSFLAWRARSLAGTSGWIVDRIDLFLAREKILSSVLIQLERKAILTRSPSHILLDIMSTRVPKT